MIEIRNSHRNVTDKICDSRHVLIVDVLRLVRHLVIVGMQAGREERDRNSVPRIVVVITAAVDPFRMPVRVELVVELEWSRTRSVDRFDNVSELGRYAA